MLAYTVTPHFISLVLYPVLRCVKWCQVRFQIFQIEMNQTLAGPELDTTLIYSTTMNLIFISCFFYSGMPLLVWIVFISLFLNYFI